jgi:hypothetical protein
MSTANVRGFIISGDDYRKFRNTNSVRKLLVSYHYIDHGQFEPVGFYVNNSDSELEAPDITLLLTTDEVLEMPFGLSTFHFRNYGGNDQFHKIIREAIAIYNATHPPPRVSIRDIDRLVFVPRVVSTNPPDLPTPFIVLDLTVEFNVEVAATGNSPASQSTIITSSVMLQPSPPAQPDSVE